MLAFEVEYLRGRAVASERHDREAAEWPPHPARLFSALVAAYKECDFSDAERKALLWLERQRPPAICHSEAFPRDVVPVFVPVNDNSLPDRAPARGYSASQIADGLRVLPERRSRQPRAFPSVTPADRTVHFIWPQAVPDEVERHRPALARLAAAVSYLGHSSSLVRIAVRDDAPTPTLVPAETGDEVLRVPTAGRLEELEMTYLRNARPSPGLFCAYRMGHTVAIQLVPESVFGDMVVFRRSCGPRIPLHAFGKLSQTVRNALMSLAGPHPREVISGHGPGGAPSQRPHVAIVPLANVGDHRYADGDLLGFAVVVPRSASRIADPDRSHIMQALVQLQKLTMGRAGEWRVERATAEAHQKSLRAEQYTGPGRCWASVTPMVLDYVPKAKPGRDLESILRLACERIGLPEPTRADLLDVSPFRGVPPRQRFRHLATRNQLRLPSAHVYLEFARPVRGPIILGAARYLGFGFCRECRDRGQ